MGITFDMGTDRDPNNRNANRWTRETYPAGKSNLPANRSSTGQSMYVYGGSTVTQGMRASGMRYTAAAEQQARLERDEAMRKVRGNTILGQTFQQMQGMVPYAPPQRGQTFRLPSWATGNVVDELRRTGKYNGETVPGLTGDYGEGFGAADFVVDEDYEGLQYLGIANNWKQGYFAVGQTPQGYVARQAIYTTNSPIAELAKLSQDELIEFRGKFALINAYAEARGQQITGEAFGLAQEQGEADRDVMSYVMAYANENAMTWDQAANAIVNQAVNDVNAGLYELDGDGSGTDEAPPIESFTATTYNLSDINAARDILTKYMEQKTGRLPRAGEVKAFLSAMNAKERANPDVAVEKYEYDEYGQKIAQTRTVTPGNVDYEAMALRHTKTPESRRFQQDLAMDTIRRLAGW